MRPRGAAIGLLRVDCPPSMMGTTMNRTDSGASKRPARAVWPRTIPYKAATALSRARVGGVSHSSSNVGAPPFTTAYEIPQPKFNGAPGKTRASPINMVRYSPDVCSSGSCANSCGSASDG